MSSPNFTLIAFFDSLHLCRFMTDVQAESIPEVLKGGDVFVKARTGTGKTLGFLIPSIDVRTHFICLLLLYTVPVVEP
jgi:Rad3-related DNA helicase